MSSPSCSSLAAFLRARSSKGPHAWPTPAIDVQCTRPVARLPPRTQNMELRLRLTAPGLRGPPRLSFRLGALSTPITRCGEFEIWRRCRAACV
jgi:hypothetical protein